MIHRIISGILLILLLAGCQTLSERRQANELQNVLRNYEGVIRWGLIEQAKRFLPPDAEFSSVKPAGTLRVTHYEVIQGPSVLEEGKALQTAVIQYIFEESQVVKEIVDQQTWTYDPQVERWYLVSPLPSFQ